MAFDSIFAGPPEDVAAPGTAQSPALGVDVTNRNLYISSGDGWQEIGNGDSPAAGSNEQIQYNNEGVLAGASGGLTNGAHWAFGNDATVDGGPTSTPDGAALSPNVVENIQESFTTNANLTNGRYFELNANPDSNPGTLDSVYGSYTILNAEGPNWSTGGAGNSELFNGAFIEYNGTSELGLAIGHESGVLNQSTGTIDYAVGVNGQILTYTTGDILTAVGALSGVSDLGTATITNAYGSNSSISGAGNGAIITNGADYYASAPSISGTDAIGTMTGYYIEDMAQSGVTTSYQIYSESTTAPAVFKGPVQTPILLADILYSAAGTPLPAASSALKGARAVVSDATLPTFLGAYTSGGAVVAPVLCNGSGWVTA